MNTFLLSIEGHVIKRLLEALNIDLETTEGCVAWGLGAFQALVELYALLDEELLE
jgi:hypothetical protein